MAIRFKCTHCTKPLAVKDHLAGKRAACPACKKPIVIPAPLAAPVDVEAFAAAALADEPVVRNDKPPEFIELDCVYCGEPVKFAADLAGKNAPCPECKRIVKVPLPKADKKKDWRDINKQGPAGAIINLPEQLEGAWGTELRGKVGQEALEEAGAVQIEVEPVGVRGWIRRGVWAASIVGALALIIYLANRNITVSQQTNAIAAAYAHAKLLEQDTKKKLHPVLAAEIDRAEGILLLNQDKVEPARVKFMEARGKLDDASKDLIVDRNLYLIELARTQLDLGMETEDQFRTKARYDWDRTVRNEVKQTLDRIKSPEAKVIALRELSSELVARDQLALAISLATSQYNPAFQEKGQPTPMLAQLTALVHAYGNVKKFENLPKPPDLTKPVTDLVARLAYAEGYARSGNLTEAKKYASAKGPLPHQLEAAIGIAGALVSDRKKQNSLTEATAVLAEVFSAKLMESTEPNPAWLRYQLCRTGARIPSYQAEVKQVAKRLPASFQRWIQLEMVVAQLERGAAIDLEKDLPDREGPTRALAWVAIGRHLGSNGPLPEDNEENALDRVFAKIGRVLSAPGSSK
jgi:hypothetical protein